MSKIITNEMYINKLKQKNPDIVPCEEYIKSTTPIMHHCLKHDIFWKISPSNALKGKGCAACRSEKLKKRFLKTNEQYKKELSEKNPNLEVLEEYVDSNTPILHRCIKHNVKWKIIPTNALKGQGCYKCKSEKISKIGFKSYDQYLEELHNSNPHITVEEPYVGTIIPILHHCSIHNVYYKVAPCNALKSYGCPQCNESKGERKIRIWLQKNKISYIFQYKYVDCKDKNPLPFDFYLPDYNCIIEYDGEQHYKANDYFGGIEKLKIQQKHDKIKNEYCKNNGILLLRIPYYKYKNIEEELDNFLFN